MALDLSPTALVNAGGAALFVLVGILVLAWGRGERRALWIGGTALVYGLLYVVQNLSPQQTFSSANNWMFATLAGLVVATASGLTLHLAREAPRGERRALAAAGVAIGVAALVLGALRFVQRSGSPAPETALSYGVYSALWLAHPLALALTAAAAFSAARASPAEAARPRRALLLLGLSFGLWAMLERLGSSALFPAATEGVRFQGAVVQLAGTALCPLILLLGTSTPREPKLGRGAFLALLGVGVLAIPIALADAAVFEATGEDMNHWGAFGIVRTVGATLLVLAVVKHDLLGVALPNLARSRSGALGAGALAALFIGAQVAQNFLSAEYGLLTGGVVAGAFLFAAQPLQRAMERITAPPPASGTGADERAETLYRENVRLVLRDRQVTAEEERHLAELGERLGIGARRAVELRHEIEAEREARP